MHTSIFRYSVLSATTGSFFAATPEGKSPAIRVRQTLIATRIIPATGGRTESPSMLVMFFIIIFIGILSSNVTSMPIAPEIKPTITVSALNTLEISFFEAPIERRIPISFVRSSRKYRL